MILKGEENDPNSLEINSNFGAGGGTRTLTVFLPLDFESSASTSSTTPALDEGVHYRANDPSEQESIPKCLSKIDHEKLSLNLCSYK